MNMKKLGKGLLKILFKVFRAALYGFIYYKAIALFPETGYLFWLIWSVGVFIGSVYVIEKK